MSGGALWHVQTAAVIDEAEKLLHSRKKADREEGYRMLALALREMELQVDAARRAAGRLPVGQDGAYHG